MIRYDTINRYQKRYIDIFDILYHYYWNQIFGCGLEVLSRGKCGVYTGSS